MSQKHSQVDANLPWDSSVEAGISLMVGTVPVDLMPTCLAFTPSML
ncbi:MAG: hypothetical protein ACFB8W_03310 [Elainellaceae cyanobacterium]